MTDINLSRKTFRVVLKPEISKEKVINILKDKKIVIRRAVFLPKMNNTSKDHIRQLFTTVGQLGTEAQGKSEIVLDPVDEKTGLKKEPIFKLITQNDNDQLLDFRFTLKNTEDSSSRPFTIASSGSEIGESIQKVETLRGDIEDEGLLKSLIDKVSYLMQRSFTEKRRVELRAKIKDLLE